MNPEKTKAKQIRSIEYAGAKQPPELFYRQARGILWTKFEDYTFEIYTPFTLSLARSYIPSLAKIPVSSPYNHPVDEYLMFPIEFALIARSLTLQLAWVLTAANGIIKDKKILDLGCGSTGDTKDSDEHYGMLFQPWLCRTLQELGIKPIGVDIGILDGEKFETHRRDLLSPGSLDFLPECSMDIVHSRAFFTSPQLDSCDDTHTMNVLQPQVERILKPNGTFIYSKGLGLF